MLITRNSIVSIDCIVRDNSANKSVCLYDKILRYGKIFMNENFLQSSVRMLFKITEVCKIVITDIACSIVRCKKTFTSGYYVSGHVQQQLITIKPSSKVVQSCSDPPKLNRNR